MGAGDQEVAGVLSAGTGNEASFAGGPEMVRLVQYTRDNWYQWIDQPEDLSASFGYTKPKAGTGVAACSGGPGRIDLLWCSDDDHLHHAWHQAGVGWQSEVDLTVRYGLTPVASDPTVCSSEAGRLDVFWRSDDNHIRHIWYPHDSEWVWETDLTAARGLTPGWEPAVCSCGARPARPVLAIRRQPHPPHLVHGAMTTGVGRPT